VDNCWGYKALTTDLSTVVGGDKVPNSPPAAKKFRKRSRWSYILLARFTVKQHTSRSTIQQQGWWKGIREERREGVWRNLRKILSTVLL